MMSKAQWDALNEVSADIDKSLSRIRREVKKIDKLQEYLTYKLQILEVKDEGVKSA